MSVTKRSDVDRPLTLTEVDNNWQQIKDFSSIDTDDGTKGFHLVSYPLIAGETGVTEYEYRWFDVRRYGYVPDGLDASATANTIAANNAVISANAQTGGATVWFPNGRAAIDAEVRIDLLDDVAIAMDSRCELFVKTTTTNWSYAIFRALTKDNISIEGGTLTGVRTGITGNPKGIGVHLSLCTNFKLKNLKINNFWGDGMMIGDDGAAGGISQYGHIEFVNINNCRRNGISFVSAQDVLVINSKFRNMNGNAPESGVDLEPDTGASKNARIKFVNTEFTGNAGHQLSTFSTEGNEEMRWINCTFTAPASPGSVQPALYPDAFRGRFLTGTDNQLIGCTFNGQVSSPAGCTIDGGTINYNDSNGALEAAHALVLGVDSRCTVSNIDVYVGGDGLVFNSSEATSEQSRRILENVTFIHDGDAPADTTILTAVSDYVTYDNVRFIQTGTSPATGYGITPTSFVGTNVKARNLYVDPLLDNGTSWGGKYINSNVYDYRSQGSSPVGGVTPNAVPEFLLDTSNGGRWWMSTGATDTDWNVVSLNLDADLVWNPASMADGSFQVSPSIIVTGAVFGDFVQVGVSISLAGVIAIPYILSADTVRIVLINHTGGVVDLASATWSIRVIRG